MRDFIAGDDRSRRSRNPLSRRAQRREPPPQRHRLHDGQLCRRPHLLPRRGHRHAGRQRDRERPRRLRRRSPVPLAGPHPGRRPGRTRTSNEILELHPDRRPEGRSQDRHRRYQGGPPGPGGQDLHQHLRHRAHHRPAIDQEDQARRQAHPDRAPGRAQRGDHAGPGGIRIHVPRQERLRAAPLSPAGLEEGRPLDAGHHPGRLGHRPFGAWPQRLPYPHPHRGRRHPPVPSRAGPPPGSSGSIPFFWPARDGPLSSSPKDKAEAILRDIQQRSRRAKGRRSSERSRRRSESRENCSSRRTTGGLRLLEPLTSELLPSIC